MRLDVHVCDGARLWPYFAKHHYLTGEYFGHFAVVGLADGQLAAFASCISFPTGTIKQPCKRAHRAVVLPDYQGLGIGVRITDLLADMVLRDGYRYYTKTSHPRLGEYRGASPLWKTSTWNLSERSDHLAERMARDGFDAAKDMSEKDYRWAGGWRPRNGNGQMYCHEYIGADAEVYDRVMNPPVIADKQMGLFD